MTAKLLNFVVIADYTRLFYLLFSTTLWYRVERLPVKFYIPPLNYGNHLRLH